MSAFSTAFKQIRRSPYQSAASVFVLSLVFFVAWIFLMSALASNRLLIYFESRPQATVFFKDSVTPQEIENLKKTLNETGKVNGLKYVSKEEALANYREQYKDEPILLELVTANILPSSLEISVYQAADLAEVSEIARKTPNIEDLVYQKEVVEALVKWITIARKIGLQLVGFLLLTSFIVTVMVTGMKIAVRKDEIETIRLLGASSWFIRKPYIVENMIYGAVAAVLAWIASWGYLYYLAPNLKDFVFGIILLPVSPIEMTRILGIEILLGMTVGALGSFMAVWRYLK